MSKRSKVIHLLGAKCAKCGYCEDIGCLDFHHVYNDGGLERQKFFVSTIYQMIIDIYDLNLINFIEVVNKRYHILCVMCHRKETQRYSKLPRKEKAEIEAKAYNYMYFLGEMYKQVQEIKISTPFGITI